MKSGFRPRLLLFFVFLGMAAGVGAAEGIFIRAPETVERGLPFQVVVHPAQPAGTVTARLENESGRGIASGRGFPVNTARDVHSTVVLIGVPSTVAPGRYRVRIEYNEGAAQLRRVRYREIEVLDREYRQSSIALSQAMSSLRTTTDPRRYQETRELMDLLGQFREDSVFALGAMTLPVASEYARVSARFGDRREFRYSDGETARSIHFGLDLAAPVGTPVYASAAGRVVFAGDRLITGYSIVLEHLPGVYGLYYHLDSIDVVAGDFVRRGQHMGTVGATGLVTGPHLHWEIRVSGVPVEPEWFLAEPLLDTYQVFSIIGTQ